MKKNQALSIVGCGILCLLLAACSPKNDDPLHVASQSQTAPASAEPTEAPLAERLQSPEIKFMQDAGEKFTASIGYPQFGIDELDQSISGYVRKAVSDFALEADETELAAVSLPDAAEDGNVETETENEAEAGNASINEAEQGDASGMNEVRAMNPFVLSGESQVLLCNDRYVSVLITSSADLQGNQPFIRQATFVYDTKGETMLTFADIFQSTSDYKPLIQTTCAQMLSLLYPHFDSEKIEAGTLLNEENYARFALSDTNLSIFFNPGQVADEEEGAIIVEIPYSHLRDVLAIDVPADSLLGDPLVLDVATNSEEDSDTNREEASDGEDVLFEEEDFTEGDEIPEE